jgi:hypothetical protein
MLMGRRLTYFNGYPKSFLSTQVVHNVILLNSNQNLEILLIGEEIFFP